MSSPIADTFADKSDQPAAKTGEWYIVYPDNFTSFQGPFATEQEAVEAAKHEFAADTQDADVMLLLRIAKHIWLSRRIEVDLL